MVSVKVATVALSAAVAVARLARASTVSAWWFCTLVASTAFALVKCYPAVRHRFTLAVRFSKMHPELGPSTVKEC